MKTLTGADILKAQDLKIEPVDVPEWGGRLYVRQFSAKVSEELDAILMGDGDKADTRNLRAHVVALAACDATGAPLFTVSQADALSEKADSAIHRVYEAAAVLNKLRKADREAEKKESLGLLSDASLTA